MSETFHLILLKKSTFKYLRDEVFSLLSIYSNLKKLGFFSSLFYIYNKGKGISQSDKHLLKEIQKSMKA